MRWPTIGLMHFQAIGIGGDSLAIFALQTSFAAEGPALFHPDPIARCLKMPPAATVDVDPIMNPFYLRGDFEGDGRTDYVAAGRNGMASSFVAGMAKRSLRVPANR